MTVELAFRNGASLPITTNLKRTIDLRKLLRNSSASSLVALSVKAVIESGVDCEALLGANVLSGGTIVQR